MAADDRAGLSAPLRPRDGATSIQPSTQLPTPSTEWSAAPLRPVAHWVSMPTGAGRTRLEMVWEVPDPMPPS